MPAAPVVKDYMREQSLRQKEMFVPLSHPPGHAQVDFGEADTVRTGQVESTFLCHGSAAQRCGVCDGVSGGDQRSLRRRTHQAFAHFGGVPQSIVYDTKLAVAKILGDGKRRRTQGFTELVSHYLFQERLDVQAKGNDKGKVEGLVGYRQGAGIARVRKRDTTTRLYDRRKTQPEDSPTFRVQY